MREVSVIIPTWNMGPYLEPLFDSIANSPLAAVVEEILFVCEKSTDRSEEIIAQLGQRQGERPPRVRMIQPDQRRGLFIARYLGAQAAVAPTIMYIDSRITLPLSSARALPQLLKIYPAMVANVDIDIRKNIYCLYWQRSHDRFYRREKDVQGPLKINADNFHSTRVGGTCFYCRRDLFVEISERYLHSPRLADDTYVFADLVKLQPLFMHPDFRINWEPRDSALVFLKHLYGRGPGLAQYHFFRRRGRLFYVMMLTVLYALLCVFMIFIHPLWALAMIAGEVVALVLSTALVAANPLEFLRLAPLHIAVIGFYGVGALRGAWMVWRGTDARSAPFDQPRDRVH